MKKNFWFLFVLLLIVGIFLQISPVAAEPVTVTDILGREVTVASPPNLAIVAGKKTATISEIPFMFKNAAGHMGKYIGGQDKGLFMSLIENDGPEMTDFTVEAIAAMKPDVLFLKGYTREDAGIAFEETGIPVVYLNLETVDDYHVDVANLGKIFGEEERAEEILSYYEEIVNRVSAKAAKITEKKKVLLLQFAESEGKYTLKVAPSGWLQTEIIKLAGGLPVWEEIGLNANSWTDVNFEQIAAWDPDAILVVNYFADPKASVATLVASEGWNQLRAVKNEQIFPFGKDTISWDSASPRWGLGVLWTFKTLYPEAAEDIDLDAEMLNFYRWFNLSDEVIQTNLIDAYHAELEPVK